MGTAFRALEAQGVDERESERERERERESHAPRSVATTGTPRARAWRCFVWKRARPKSVGETHT